MDCLHFFGILFAIVLVVGGSHWLFDRYRCSIEADERRRAANKLKLEEMKKLPQFRVRVLTLEGEEHFSKPQEPGWHSISIHATARLRTSEERAHKLAGILAGGSYFSAGRVYIPHHEIAKVEVIEVQKEESTDDEQIQ